MQFETILILTVADQDILGYLEGDTPGTTELLVQQTTIKPIQVLLTSMISTMSRCKAAAII